MSPLLEVTDLAVRYAGEVDALRGVSFRLGRGDSLAVVGESGSGKTTLALCLTGLIQPPEARGSVRLDGQELLGAPAELLRSLRWRKVALTLQGAPFNPVVPVGAQLAEPLRDHLGLRRHKARARVEEVAAETLLDPAKLDRFPHQLSGGERRRAALAMALVLDPELLVLDEPTAGLDPVSTQELVERIRALARARDLALLVISHDLPDAARLAARTMVLYAGEPMEVGPTKAVIADPAHPYSWALVNAYPVMTTTKELRPIRGQPPDPRAVPPGCPFHPRCTQAEDICWQQHPDLMPSRGRLVACHFGGLKILLSASGLHQTFRTRRQEVPALRGVSLHVREGESVGVIGPSGSGKTTLARILAGHLAPDAGEVLLEGEALPTSWRPAIRPRARGATSRRARGATRPRARGATREARRRVQLVMQDPWDALSPRLTVAQLVREPLDLTPMADDERDAAVASALESVGLAVSGPFLDARTHELSGGQLQRIALARALVLR
ncbi:MAG: ATP-binding cassette domain-containing protein, partial [Actinomycetota bacterium]|nr:ATP-binding cassette domain-containing protein [Actinomycetota bacterium]